MANTNDWVFDLESKFFTIVQYKVRKEIGSKYPNMYFTTSNINSKSAFPTIYFHMLSGNEIGTDLVRQEVCGINATVQVETYSNVSQDEAKAVMQSVFNAMKSLGFVTTMPTFDNEQTVYRCICRFNRIVGAGDTF